MYNITLITTRHESLGKCNSNELYQIFELINPDVIFEELPPSCFDDYYLYKTRSTLESETINKYIQFQKIDHIPVDIDNLPSGNFFKDYEDMIERVEGLVDINGFIFRNLNDKNKTYIESHGFNYLNSINCININNEIYNVIETGLRKINNDKLFETFETWKEFHKLREAHMLKNIYRYSEKHSYERAIFTIGAAHRKSIIEKISEFQKNEKVKLNWVI